jgi:hypothetical protein
MSSRIPTARARLCLAATGSVVLLTLGWHGASAAAPELQPTATCPADAVAELHQTIDFVRGQTWAEDPGTTSLNIAPDLNACRVVLNIGQLSPREEAALQAGAGSRLAIEYRRDWARQSRVLLILWIVFGGSGLVWTFRRYARR